MIEKTVLFFLFNNSFLGRSEKISVGAKVQAFLEERRTPPPEHDPEAPEHFSLGTILEEKVQTFLEAPTTSSTPLLARTSPTGRKEPRGRSANFTNPGTVRTTPFPGVGEGGESPPALENVGALYAASSCAETHA